jgi:ornithine cyclodeaminase/alanine dehydrogenase-like protein (mu-crystallin family)
MMRLLGASDVDALVSSELGLRAARETADLVADGSFTTGRLQTGDADAWMRVLVGFLPTLDLIGYKEFHRVGKDVYYHVVLHRYGDGTPLGIVDGRRLTSLRTASTATLPYQRVFGDNPFSMGVVGSGEEAREGLRAVAAGTSLQRARVYSPTAANRTELAETLGAELGIPVEPCMSIADALAGADAAYVATAATSPVVSAADVRHLRLTAAVGATRPDHHELSGDVLAEAATVVVDCVDACEEPGDARDALRFGWDPGSATLLGNWLREPTDEPILFKSIGSVEQDLVLARQLLLAAEQLDLGREIEPVASLRTMR